MGVDQAVSGAESRLVAGLGFRRGAQAADIVALIGRALAAAGLGDRLVAIATAADRAAEPAIREAAAAFGLVPLALDADALVRADHRVPTRSVRIERLRGVGSLAEAAALAAAGEAGHLALARIVGPGATCALAVIRPSTLASDGAVKTPRGLGEVGWTGEGAARLLFPRALPDSRIALGCHRALPPPSAGEGGPRVSEGRERGAPHPDTWLPSPDLARGPPSPAGGRGKRASPGRAARCVNPESRSADVPRSVLGEGEAAEPVRRWHGDRA